MITDYFDPALLKAFLRQNHFSGPSPEADGTTPVEGDWHRGPFSITVEADDKAKRLTVSIEVSPQRAYPDDDILLGYFMLEDFAQRVITAIPR